jgi:hypothetical protein
MTKQPRRAAVIGAGLCGLTCAHDLAQEGWDVQVFDKSRGLGGRLAVKRLPDLGNVDLGAQFMTASTVAFATLLATAAAKGYVAPWQGSVAYLTAKGREEAREQVRWVGVPGMNSWLADLWPRQAVRFEERIESCDRLADGRWVINDKRDKLYDAVILAMPPAQAADLARGTSLEAPLRSVPMTPCWAGLALFERSLRVDFVAAFIRGGQLDWIANNQTKPGRTEHPAAWTIHAGGALSTQLIDQPKEVVAKHLMMAVAAEIGIDLPPGHIELTHLWRYASPQLATAPGILWDANIGLGAGGDWAIGGRVEGAFTAGKQLAAAVCAS